MTTPSPQSAVTLAAAEQAKADARKALANRLRSAREALGMSVADAAAICENVSAQYITALEAAEVKFPAPFALHALAGVYVISYIKLMELAGHVRPNPLTGELKAHELT